MRKCTHNIKLFPSQSNLLFKTKIILIYRPHQRDTRHMQSCDDDDITGRELLGIIIFVFEFALKRRLVFFYPCFTFFRCRSPPFSFPLKFKGKEESQVGKEYHVKLNGELVPVTEEVYRAYQQPKWRENKRTIARVEKEVSLDAMLENDDSVQLITGQALVDEIVADKLLLNELLSALAVLNNDERSLIDEIFYNDKTERQVAKIVSTSHQAVHKKKNRILAKLKKLLEL